MDEPITEFFNSDEALEIWGPRTVQVEITNPCNLRCNMCDRWKWEFENSELRNQLSLEQLESLFSELKACGTNKILISGGEPLLRRDFTKIIESIKKKGMKVTVINNGTMLTKDIASILADADAEIIVSIDGSNPQIHNEIRGVVKAFERAVNGVRNAVSESNRIGNGKVGINYTVQPKNASDIYNATKLAQELGVSYIRFGICHGQPKTAVTSDCVEILKNEITRIRSESHKTKIILSPYFSGLTDRSLDPKHFEEGLPAYELFRKEPVPCMLTYQCCLIDAAGDVYPCTYTYFDNQPSDGECKDKRNENKIGNVLKTPFKEIWSGERFSKFRQQHNPVDVTKFASSCGQCEHYFGFKAVKDTLSESKTKDEVLNNLRNMNTSTWSNQFEITIE